MPYEVLLSTNVAGRAWRVHFSGIGGTAMVAGARLAIEAGCEVRGSDNPLYPPTSEMVAALGVPVAEGYRPENLDWDPDLVVIGNAAADDGDAANRSPLARHRLPQIHSHRRQGRDRRAAPPEFDVGEAHREADGRRCPRERRRR